MNKFKRILLPTLLAMGVIAANTVEAGKPKPPPPPPSPVYKTPIVQSANGVYVGTLVGSSIGLANGQTYPLNALISTKGYIFAVTNSGKVKEAFLDGYESADCGGVNGIPTLMRVGMLNMSNSNVFKIGYGTDPTSVPSLPGDNITIDPDLYYIPKSSALYPYTVYVYDIYGGGTRACVPVVDTNSSMLQMLGTDFYKPILNDPAVTGVNLTTLNSLPKPFNISISY